MVNLFSDDNDEYILEGDDRFKVLLKEIAINGEVRFNEGTQFHLMSMMSGKPVDINGTHFALMEMTVPRNIAMYLFLRLAGYRAGSLGLSRLFSENGVISPEHLTALYIWFKDRYRERFTKQLEELRGDEYPVYELLAPFLISEEN